MDKLVEHLFVFTWGWAIQDFWWTYTEYKLSSHDHNTNKKTEPKSEPKSIPNNISQIPIPETNNKNKKLSYNEQREFEVLWTEIQQLEHRKEEINLMFQRTEIDHNTLKELGKELNLLITSLDIKESRRFELLERE
jgi:ATP-binding cassette subfamily F protein uup